MRHTYSAVALLLGVACIALLGVTARKKATVTDDSSVPESAHLYQIAGPETVTVERFFDAVTGGRASIRFTLFRQENRWLLKENPGIPLMQDAAGQIVREFAAPAAVRRFSREEYERLAESAYLPTENTEKGAVVIVANREQRAEVTFLKPVPDGSGWYVTVAQAAETTAGILPVHAYALCCFTPETLQDAPRFPLPPPGSNVTLQITGTNAAARTLTGNGADELLERLRDLQYARIPAGETHRSVAPENAVTAVRILPPPGSPATEIIITKYKPQQDIETGENYDIYTVSSLPFVYRILPVYSPF